ncbi:hypothetical protein AMECASPLE_036398, partial [Ameca splendens]
EPVEVARASILDASWTPSFGGVPGTSHQEEAQGTAQDTLEGLCLSAGLGTPWAPPGGAGGGVWGEGPLAVSAESAAPANRSRIKRKTTRRNSLIYMGVIICLGRVRIPEWAGLASPHSSEVLLYLRLTLLDPYWY